ncbi:hypothetical protein D3C81_2286570 [compost metagenome]
MDFTVKIRPADFEHAAVVHSYLTTAVEVLLVIKGWPILWPKNRKMLLIASGISQ